MLRLRLGSLFVAAGLGLVSGCTSLSEHSWFSSLRGRSSSACCTGMDAGCCESAMMDDLGPVLTPPAGQGAFLSPLTPQNTVPPLSPAPQPRLVPQPATPTPYTPPPM
jgi:hypothetical protein